MKNIKNLFKLTSIIFVIMVFFAPLYAGASPLYRLGITTNDGKTLKLSGNKDFSTVVAEIPSGGYVTIVSIEDGLYKVRTTENVEGWASTRYTTLVDTAVEGAPYQLGLTSNEYYLMIRQDPYIGSPHFARFSPSSYVNISGEQNGFYQVIVNGRTGYISKDYTSLISPQNKTTGSLFTYPNKTVTANFGDDYTSTYTGHLAMDLVTNDGKVRSIYDGTVVAVGNSSDYGNYITIEHNLNGQTFKSFYAHMAKWAFYGNGDYVYSGDIIGDEGSTGMSTGRHIHLAIFKSPNNYNVPRGYARVKFSTSLDYYQDGSYKLFNPSSVFSSNGGIIN